MKAQAMSCFSGEVQKLFKDWKHEKLCSDLESAHAEMLKRRVDFVEYGDTNKLTNKDRVKLNSQLLSQSLLHRAESLLSATGAMLTAKNVYGLALIARGHVEATAVLGYFCKRADSLRKGNVEFPRFEADVANGVLGAEERR